MNKVTNFERRIERAVNKENYTAVYPNPLSSPAKRYRPSDLDDELEDFEQEIPPRILLKTKMFMLNWHQKITRRKRVSQFLKNWPP